MGSKPLALRRRNCILLPLSLYLSLELRCLTALLLPCYATTILLLLRLSCSQSPELVPKPLSKRPVPYRQRIRNKSVNRLLSLWPKGVRKLAQFFRPQWVPLRNGVRNEIINALLTRFLSRGTKAVSLHILEGRSPVRHSDI